MDINSENIRISIGLAGLDLPLERAALSLPALRQILEASARLDELKLERFSLVGGLWDELKTDDQLRDSL